MITLANNVTNSGIYLVSGQITNSLGELTVPSSIHWSLTDKWGNIINNRNQVEINPPVSAFVITLTGDDIDIEDSHSRVFTLDVEYDSVAYGNDLPLRAQGSFTLGDWVAREV